MKQDSRQINEIELQNLQSKYDNMIYRTAVIYLKDRHLAEDAYQETFFKIYKHLPKFETAEQEKIWVTRVTINVCKDFYKKRWLHDILYSSSFDDNEGDKFIAQADIKQEPHNNYLATEHKRELLNKVLRLPIIYKDVIILYYYHEYNTEEIAKITKTKHQTVRKRLERARKILKNNLEGSDISYG